MRRASCLSTLLLACTLLPACHLLLGYGSGPGQPGGELGPRRESGGPLESGRGEGRQEGGGGGDAAGVPQSKIIDGKTWTLVFDDEFGGPALDPEKWSRVETGAYDSVEPQYFLPADVLVENGLLRLRSQRAPVGFKGPSNGKSYVYTAGQITSEGNFWTTYGRIELRARAGSGKGVHGKLEMTSARKWQQMLFDLFEVLGDQPGKLFNSFTYDTPAGSYGTVGSIDTSDLTQSFHDVAVQWEPGQIVWSVDGKTVPIAMTHYDAHPMFLRFRALVASSVATTTTFPQYRDVDYVRVYQRADLPAPSKVLLNGSFENEGASLNSWLLPWTMKNVLGSMAGYDRDTNAVADGKASLRVWVGSISPKSSDVQLSYARFPLKKGKSYTVTFKAKANLNRPIGVVFGSDYPPDWTVRCEARVQVGTEWTPLTATCTPTVDDWPATLRFDFAAASTAELGMVWLDDVRMTLP